MDPFWLFFRRPETEKQYRRSVIDRGLRKSDVEFLWIVAGLCSAAAARFAFIPQSWHHAPTMILSALQYAWTATVWKRMSSEELTSRRTAMVLAMRTFTLVMNRLMEVKAPPIPTTSLMAACLSDGIVNSVLLGWCLRVKFEYHFPFQVASTLGLIFSSTKGRCANLMGTSGACRVRVIAHNLDSWAKGFMTTMYGRRGGEPLICPCLHVMVWLHVFVILMLQSYGLWNLEWRSRRAFIQALPEERRRLEGLVVGDDGMLYKRLMHGFVLIVAFAVMWELNFFLVKAVESWGL